MNALMLVTVAGLASSTAPESASSVPRASDPLLGNRAAAAASGAAYQLRSTTEGGPQTTLDLSGR